MANSTVASNCTTAHTKQVLATGACQCFSPFTGASCEFTLEYWTPVTMSLYCVQLAVFLLVGYWTLLRIIVLARANGGCLKRNLVSIVLVFSLVAAFMKALEITMDERTWTGNWHVNRALATARIVVIPVSFLFWLAASALITGFWFDVLAQKMRSRMAKPTRIACIVGAALVLLSIPGLYLTFQTALVVLGYVLVMLPLVVNTAGLIVINILITRLTRAEHARLHARTRARADYAVKLFWTNSISWLLFTLGLLGQAVLAAGDVNIGPLTFMAQVLGAVTMLATFGICFSIILLCDRNGGPLVLTRRLCCGRDPALSAASSGSTSTAAMAQSSAVTTSSNGAGVQVTGSSTTPDMDSATSAS
jgi:hypothetical protein